MQKSEDSAESKLIIFLISHWSLIEASQSESVSNYIAISVEEVVGIDDGVGEFSVFADCLIFYFSHFYEDESDIGDESFYGEHHAVLGVFC